jgi:hypothetical protein
MDFGPLAVQIMSEATELSMNDGLAQCASAARRLIESAKAPSAEHARLYRRNPPMKTRYASLTQRSIPPRCKRSLPYSSKTPAHCCTLGEAPSAMNRTWCFLYRALGMALAVSIIEFLAPYAQQPLWRVPFVTSIVLVTALPRSEASRPVLLRCTAWDSQSWFTRPLASGAARTSVETPKSKVSGTP